VDAGARARFFFGHPGAHERCRDRVLKLSKGIRAIVAPLLPVGHHLAGPLRAF
jgi:hypothetical protein